MFWGPLYNRKKGHSLKFYVITLPIIKAYYVKISLLVTETVHVVLIVINTKHKLKDENITK